MPPVCLWYTPLVCLDTARTARMSAICLFQHVHRGGKGRDSKAQSKHESDFLHHQACKWNRDTTQPCFKRGDTLPRSLAVWGLAAEGRLVLVSLTQSQGFESWH